MKIVSITTAVNYHGELRITLPSIVHCVDHAIVYTTPQDRTTQQIVRDIGADLRVTADFYRRRAAFNKSGVIRAAQQEVNRRMPDHWVLLIDADILLPRDTRQKIEAEKLDRRALYGMKRWDYATPEDFEAQTPTLDYPHDHAGYFQLYHRRDLWYPRFSHHAGKCDYAFKRQFSDRRFIPGRCHHLGLKSQNWQGRTTPHWVS